MVSISLLTFFGLIIAPIERNVVPEIRYGSLKIINDGTTVAKDVTYVLLEDKIKEKAVQSSDGRVVDEIARQPLSYLLTLVSKYDGANGSFIIEKILASDNLRYGYNAGKYKDIRLLELLTHYKVLYSN
ncbi:hypothetical protein ACP70R_041985 [Stipagrostis hirtigluma subsp. patula]